MLRFAIPMVVFVGAATTLAQPVAPSSSLQSAVQPRTVDMSRASRAGIRRLAGKHLTLYTDLASDSEVDRLPEVFDQAVPQWAAYFEIVPDEVRDWRMQGYLIGDRDKFQALGLMPRGHEAFRHGFALGHELWLHEQPTPYYRRHLLLHEGTHGFMASQLGGCGPGWYMEGMAELLATHVWDETTGKLALRHMPRARSEVPMLGRIKLVRDAYAADRARGVAAVMAIDNRRFLDNEEYAWCWALARLLDDHPRYRDRFRALKELARAKDFDEQFRQRLADDWEDLSVEWQVFVAALEHGHDVARTAIEFQQGVPLGPEGAEVSIDSARGWQSSGVLLEAGRRYQVTAAGRYAVDRDDDGIWWCEPNGVTIEYHAGRPLGMLLGAIDARGPAQPAAATGFLRPLGIGSGRILSPQSTGTLYLRINDSPARLSENDGRAVVRIAPIGGRSN